MTLKTTFLLIFIPCLLLMACGGKTRYAPVVDGWRQPAGQKSGYIVQKGDTVYSIAWDYGMDYRDIVKANHLSLPYTIHVGQKLKMSSTTSAAMHSVKPQKTPSVTVTKVAATKPNKVEPNNSHSAHWLWPTQGKLIKNYAPNGDHGIDISGSFGQPVVAASAGKVVYAGSGLRGYGRLIIIKHNESYLSAYAFNKSLLIKEGMAVKAGQKIAEMGKDESGHNALHFEIRRDGKPVNPMLYLGRDFFYNGQRGCGHDQRKDQKSSSKV